MKILIIGGNGTIGRKVAHHFKNDNEVIIAGKTSGDLTVDISNSVSIKEMFEKTGKLDAIICIAGEAKWAEFNKLSEEDYYIGLKSKLMGQVNLVRIGRKYLNPNGSITLTTGVLADDPVVQTTSAALVNGGIHSFVKAVVLEIDNGLRVNVVSPDMVEDAYDKYKNAFPGHNPVPMSKVVNAYVKSVQGKINGQIIRVYA
ncbi:short chain dehydrogenase [Zunongwangia pacifica]|uniref:Short chain dehydrogenase n=1 Tax=Zunongwangia pacifica TaxID=2911062 RepID=A0A9X2CR69_9FLAO|nr:short chain dehydrogenase [Zunongwangia pacifica]MCL6220907.1 short chain dehydrogenase [Zunongwangia pacifica]